MEVLRKIRCEEGKMKQGRDVQKEEIGERENMWDRRCGGEGGIGGLCLESGDVWWYITAQCMVISHGLFIQGLRTRPQTSLSLLGLEGAPYHIVQFLTFHVGCHFQLLVSLYRSTWPNPVQQNQFQQSGELEEADLRGPRQAWAFTWDERQWTCAECWWHTYKKWTITSDSSGLLKQLPSITTIWQKVLVCFYIFKWLSGL